MVVPKYLWVLTTELAARHLYGGMVAHQCLQNMCTPDVSQHNSSYLPQPILKLLQFMLSNNEKLSVS